MLDNGLAGWLTWRILYVKMTPFKTRQPFSCSTSPQWRSRLNSSTERKQKNMSETFVSLYLTPHFLLQISVYKLTSSRTGHWNNVMILKQLTYLTNYFQGTMETKSTSNLVTIPILFQNLLTKTRFLYFW